MTTTTNCPAVPLSRCTDRYGRPLRSLRISVTDRCNMRCRYCMPEEDYLWLPRESILSFEEIDRLVGIFSRARRAQGPPHRRRAAAAARSPRRWCGCCAATRRWTISP